MKPLVTVAIAAYNVEKFLIDGMNSVFNQTYENLEIILVDDGSTDNTPQMCDEIAKKDSRVVVFHKENGGLGSARNVGIDNANGKYIYFFDVDDTIEKELIDYNVEIAEKYNTEMNIFSFNVAFSDSNDTESVIFNEEYIDNNLRLKEVYCEELLFVKHGNGFAWNKFYNLDFLKSKGYKFGNQRIQQDEPFNMQLYPTLTSVYISSKPLYNYVIYSSGNNGNRYIPNKFDIFTDVYYNFCNFYKNWNLDSDRVKDYIYKRYYSGIINTLTINIHHKDNPMKTREKIRTIDSIINNKEVINAVEYLKNINFKERYFKYICKKDAFALYSVVSFYLFCSKIKHKLKV